MNDCSTDGDAVVVFIVTNASQLTAHLLENRRERIMHVLGHLQLVVAPFEVEAWRRNSPFIDYARIDVHVGLIVGNHLPSAGQSDSRSVFLTNELLQVRSVALVNFARAVEGADTRHAVPTADFDVIAARKFLIL